MIYICFTQIQTNSLYKQKMFLEYFVVIFYTHHTHRMITINKFIKLLTLTWIRRLIIKNSEWSNIFTETKQRNIIHLF